MKTTIEPTAAALPSTRSPRARTPTPPIPEALAALATSQRPLAQAGPLLEHHAGVSPPPATLDRQGQRQGQRTQPLRTQLD